MWLFENYDKLYKFLIWYKKFEGINEKDVFVGLLISKYWLLVDKYILIKNLDLKDY